MVPDQLVCLDEDLDNLQGMKQVRRLISANARCLIKLFLMPDQAFVDPSINELQQDHSQSLYEINPFYPQTPLHSRLEENVVTV
jgi:hypothetical protein